MIFWWKCSMTICKKILKIYRQCPTVRPFVLLGRINNAWPPPSIVDRAVHQSWAEWYWKKNRYTFKYVSNEYVLFIHPDTQVHIHTLAHYLPAKIHITHTYIYINIFSYIQTNAKNKFVDIYIIVKFWTYPVHKDTYQFIPTYMER